MGFRKFFFVWLAVQITATIVYAQSEVYVEQLPSIEAFKGQIIRGAIAIQGNNLALVSSEKKLKLFDSNTLLEKTIPANLSVPVEALTFSGSGKMLALGTAEGQVYISDLAAGGAIKNFSIHSQDVKALALQDEMILFSAGGEKVVVVTDLTSGNSMGSLPTFEENITAIAIRQGLKQFAVGLSTGQVRTYAFAKFAPMATLTDANEKISVLCYSPDNKYLAAGSIDGNVVLWDAQTGALKMKYNQKKPIWSISFDSKGRWIVVSASDSTIKFYDLITLTNIKTITDSEGFATFTSFLNDETLLAATNKGQLKRWKISVVPPDTMNPVIVLEKPAVLNPPAKILGREYEVRGLVYDDGELKEVTLNGVPVALSTISATDETKIPTGMKTAKVFNFKMQLDSIGINPFEIKVTDNAKHSISQSGVIQRLSPTEAVEIESPISDSETSAMSIPVKFRVWFDVASYSISVNMVDIVMNEETMLHVAGDIITDEVPLVAGYSQIQITIKGRSGEKFSKTVGVNRKTSILAGMPALSGSARKERVPGSGPQTWAVVVGVSEYQNPGIPSLKYADKDAESLANFLRRPEGGGINSDHMKVLLNKDATLSNVREALINFLNQAIDMDLVVIYFAGHGMPEPAKASNMYLLTHDSDPNALGTSAFPMWDIETVLKRYINAKRVVVFTDACHSGGISVNFATRGLGSTEQNLVNQYLADLSKTKEGIVVFTASAAGEVSQEFPEYGHGVFTYFMLEGLEGKADYNNDYTVTINELMQYTEEQVKRKTRGAQNPTRSQTEYDKEMTMSLIPH